MERAMPRTKDWRSAAAFRRSIPLPELRLHQGGSVDGPHRPFRRAMREERINCFRPARDQ